MRWIDKTNSSRFFMIFLILICILTVILSLLLYSYLITSSKKVGDIAIDYTTINSMSKIRDLKKIIENKFQVVNSNLGLLSNELLIKNQNTGAIPVIDSAQSITGDITESYDWFDDKGKMIWSAVSDKNKTVDTHKIYFNEYEKLFKIVKERFKPAIATFFDTKNITNMPRIIISYPVLSSKYPLVGEKDHGDNFTGNYFIHSNSKIITTSDFKKYNTSFFKENFYFRGVVDVSIDNLKVLSFIDDIVNSTINNILATKAIQNMSELNAKYYLFDKNGMILFSDSGKFNTNDINNNVVEMFLKKIREIKNDDHIIQLTISHNNIVFTDIKNTSNPFDTVSVLDQIKPVSLNDHVLNYIPILLNEEPFLYLITLTPLTFSESTNAFIDSQITNTFIFIGILFSLIFAFITIIMYINKNLKNLVEEKTRDLVEAFVILNDNNKQLQEVNDKLVKSGQQQREFIDNAAHELRTPTQAITGYCEMNEEVFNELLKEKITDERSRNLIFQISGYQNLISKNSARLSDLINDLLDVAKFDSNNITLTREKFDLVQEINNLIKVTLTKKIKDKEIKINFSKYELNEYWITADRLRITQILNNLIDNAIKFSERGGVITISILNRDDFKTLRKKGMINNDIPDDWKEIKNDEILIRISDTGKGIKPQILPKIFDRFVTDSESGTGLGLFIATKLVKAHGGRIRAFNNKNKPGATFEFVLPKYKNIN